MTLVIGICGLAGSGKSTVAKYLARNYGATVYALATPLKEIVRRAFDLSEDQLYGPQFLKEAEDARYNVSPRWLMQRIGTEGIRAVLGDDFWVKHTMVQIAHDRPELAVIEDVRFLSEVSGIAFDHENLRREGAYIWKIQTPWDYPKADRSTWHRSESESSLIDADHVIAPSPRTLENLYQEIDRACDKFNIKPAISSIEAP